VVKMRRSEIFNLESTKSTRQMLRNNMAQPEVILWSKLKGKQLDGFKFRRQYGIENFVIDFYCPQVKLAIEIDGDSHFSENSQEKDKWRQKIIEKYGINFLRFTNIEINENLTGVLDEIRKRTI
jgi:very-short-patch-repair endonuclease